MIYQTLHTPPITPEELYRLETLLKNLKGVNILRRATCGKNLAISHTFIYNITLLKANLFSKLKTMW